MVAEAASGDFDFSGPDSFQCRRSVLLPRHPLRFAAVASGAEAVASPPTQLRVGELIPPDYAGGSSGVTLQVALVSVHRGAVALSLGAQAGALVWAPVGARCWAQSRRRFFDHQPVQGVRYCHGERA